MIGVVTIAPGVGIVLVKTTGGEGSNLPIATIRPVARDSQPYLHGRHRENGYCRVLRAVDFVKK